MPAQFTCDLGTPSQAFPHFWEHTIGSGHAPLALRADYQQQLTRAHKELGFKYVRFHGLLSDDMGTMTIQMNQPLYSFFNIDQVFDFLLSIGMKPFVELSFMPTGLSSGDQIVFHYRANVTLPRDYEKWALLISRLTAHWIDRYGLAEVRTWFFEVWNEPNLTAFGDGRKETYFELYRHTVAAINAIDSQLRVGGPATATNDWIEEFIAFCTQNGLPADFISTHHYPTDAFGKPGDDTETQLSLSKRSVLREQTAKARQQAAGRPLYYTEWSSSSNPRDALHDEPYAASFLAKTIMEATGLVEAYSYWTFSDIFEENYFPSVPFHGGFGLLNLHGIAKPAYRTYELLHALGNEQLPVEGTHATVDAWVVRGEREVTVFLTNFQAPRRPIASETVKIKLLGAGTPRSATLKRIDEGHANAKPGWLALGSPDYLSPAQVAELQARSTIQSETQSFTCTGGQIELTATLEPMSVNAITFSYAALAPASLRA